MLIGRKLLTLFPALLLMGLATPNAGATVVVTVEWTGTVTEVPTGNASLLGESITGSYSYLSPSPVCATPLSNATCYDTSHVSSFSVGGALGSFSDQEIVVANDEFAGIIDLFRSGGGDNVSYTGSSLGGLTPEFFVVDIRDTDANAISDESLPTSLVPGDWDLDPGVFDGQISFEEFAVGVLRFDMDSFTATSTSIPEPASLALLGIGLAGLGFARKRKAH